jgi:hypothetical protein
MRETKPCTIGAAACFLAVAHASAAAAANGHSLHNTRLTILFGSDANGFSASDADRVDAITWVNSAGTPVTNLVTSGGPLHCGDPQEFFGEAYGDSGDTGVPLPLAVIGGVTSKWTGKKPAKGATAIKSLTSCDATLDATTTTHYAVSSSATLINTLKITRAFKFSANPSSGNMRAYVPRLPLSAYPNVLAPNAAGAVQTYQANSCPLNCTVTDWNGKWFADDDGSGNGMVVFRSAANDPPANLTVDWDGYSTSNNTAVTVTMPTGGWSGTVTETEYLCFYDAKSWPAANRAKGVPPIGCTGVPK